MTREQFQRWLDAYVDAWRSNDREQIAALFSDNAEYLWNPWDEPVRGRDAIVNAWTQDPDPAGSWDARYEVLAVDGDVAVAQGRTEYREGHPAMSGKRYDNIFVCRFDADGRCRSFTEWFMEPRGQSQQAGPEAAA